MSPLDYKFFCLPICVWCPIYSSNFQVMFFKNFFQFPFTSFQLVDMDFRTIWGDGQFYIHIIVIKKKRFMSVNTVIIYKEKAAISKTY